MDNITKQKAVEIIKKAFDLKDFNNREDGKSFYREDGESVSFFFDTRQYDRPTVIEKLKECLQDMNLEQGQFRIDSMTLFNIKVTIMPKTEFKIGETFQCGLVKLRVEHGIDNNVACEGCYFDTEEPCLADVRFIGPCDYISRKDKQNVIFVKVEE